MDQSVQSIDDVSNKSRHRLRNSDHFIDFE